MIDIQIEPFDPSRRDHFFLFALSVYSTMPDSYSEDEKLIEGKILWTTFTENLVSILIACDKKNLPIGIIIYQNASTVDNCQQGIYIRNLWVSPNYRNQNVATNLYNKAVGNKYVSANVLYEAKVFFEKKGLQSISKANDGSWLMAKPKEFFLEKYKMAMPEDLVTGLSDAALQRFGMQKVDYDE